MKIELVKFFTTRGTRYYIVKIDGQYVEGTLASDLPQAIEIYEEVKKKHKKGNSEVIISENI